jgi:hypothetical protein
MSEFALILNVIVLFLFRIGVPLLLLVIVGIIIERWQSKLHENAQNYRSMHKSVS